VTAILSSICAVLGILLGYGLPLVFWIALLIWPARIARRRMRRPPANAVAA